MDRDRLDLVTPEGVTLQLELAGLGSRGLAAILDLLIQGAILIGVAIVAVNLDGTLAFLVFTLAFPVLFFGYPVLFELLMSGQTPGKAAMKLRVVRQDGGPVGVASSVLRNFVRIIDFLPWFYGVGGIAVFATTKNQRLGDIAAGTLVIREPSERPQAFNPGPLAGRWDLDKRDRQIADGWDVSAVTNQELAVVKQFMARRTDLDTAARNKMAGDLARRLRPKVSHPPQELTDQRFLELVVAAKNARA